MDDYNTNDIFEVVTVPKDNRDLYGEYTLPVPAKLSIENAISSAIVQGEKIDIDIESNIAISPNLTAKIDGTGVTITAGITFVSKKKKTYNMKDK